MSDQEKNTVLNFLEEMIKKFPNDQELGNQIRKYYLTTKKQIKTK